MKSNPQSTKTAAEKEQQAAAGNSVLAAVFLTAIKLVVGFFTGSLGILAEAAHSGLDLVAALVTFVAVRISGKPADEEHTYGHGKIESFSALIEIVLLFITCVWIVYESIQRLFFHFVEIDAGVWAFLTMGISIVVDINRSKMLYNVSRKYNNQALEADALHFSTDIWSSSVVLAGLALVWSGQNIFPAYAELLRKADSVAALGVAAIIILVSCRLGKRTIDILLDRAPEGMTQQIAAVANHVDGVLGTGQVRVRRSGPLFFVDLSVDVARNLPFERTHAIADSIETLVQRIAPGADVLVHTNPRVDNHESIAERIRTVVSKNQLAAHNISVHEAKGQTYVDLHLEVDDSLSLRLAHELASRVEQELRADIPCISHINTHIESRETGIGNGLDVTVQESGLVQKIIETTNKIIGRVCCHNVTILLQDDCLAVSLHCTLDADLSISQVHDITTRIESHLKEDIPRLESVLVHAEPLGM
jgi:cation diffusion facilitator family transporter